MTSWQRPAALCQACWHKYSYTAARTVAQAACVLRGDGAGGQAPLPGVQLRPLLAALPRHGAAATALLRDHAPGLALPPLLWWVGGMGAGRADTTLRLGGGLRLCLPLLQQQPRAPAWPWEGARCCLAPPQRSPDGGMLWNGTYQDFNCWVYMSADLEYGMADNPGVDGTPAVDALLALVAELLQERFGLAYDPRSVGSGSAALFSGRLGVEGVGAAPRRAGCWACVPASGSLSPRRCWGRVVHRPSLPHLLPRRFACCAQLGAGAGLIYTHQVLPAPDRARAGGGLCQQRACGRFCAGALCAGAAAAGAGLARGPPLHRQGVLCSVLRSALQHGLVLPAQC